MCPNDWEWGGLNWSINFDCLPDDYSSANNAAAARVCAHRRKRDSWRLSAPRYGLIFLLSHSYMRQILTGGGGGGGEEGEGEGRCEGFTQISLAFYLSFKSFQAWCDSSAVGVRQKQGAGRGRGGGGPREQVLLGTDFFIVVLIIYDAVYQAIMFCSVYWQHILLNWTC